MRLYVDMSAYNCRVDNVRMKVWFYLVELTQWVELGNIHEDESGHFINVWA